MEDESCENDREEPEPWDRVRWTGRAPMKVSDVIFSGSFYSLLVLQLVLGFVIVRSTNASMTTDGGCAHGWKQLGSMCFSESMIRERDECFSRHPGSTVIGETSYNRNLWDVLAVFPHVPIRLCILMFFLAALLLAVLPFVARAAIWACLGITSVAFMYFTLQHAGASGRLNFGFLILFALTLSTILYSWRELEWAAIVISTSCQGLQETFSNHAIVLISFTLSSSYVCVWALTMVKSTSFWEVYETDSNMCHMGPSTFARNSRWIFGVVFIPTLLFFQNVSRITCAAGIGGWFLHQRDPQAPQYPAGKGFMWAFTTCSGCALRAAVVVNIVHEMRQCAQSRFRLLFCCFPFHTLFWIAHGCFGKFVQDITPFMLIIRTFYGDRLPRNPRKASEILDQHLGSAAIHEPDSSVVLKWISTLLSITFGFVAWHSFDSLSGSGILSNPLGMDRDVIRKDIEIPLMVFGLGLLVLHPICTLVFAALLAGNTKDHSVDGFLAGAVVGSICALLFRFVSDIVSACLYPTFYCFALEADAGRKQQRFFDLYEKLCVLTGTEHHPARAVSLTQVVPAHVTDS